MTLVTGSGYRIADEPRPGAMEHLAVDPLWPFLAIMFGGAWLYAGSVKGTFVSSMSASPRDG